MDMKNIAIIMLAMAAMASDGLRATAGDLRFDPDSYTTGSLTMPDGTEVSYKAYEGIYYVTNVEDSTYQTLNYYVPDGMSADSKSPILLRTYVGGYMASTAKTPSPTDATGRALKEGYAVCIPGSRGSNSMVVSNGDTVYTGTAPNGLLDLKAAVRYLRYNNDVIPGNADMIFTDGTSAGGAMSSLLGATANAPEYEPYLTAMGAAVARDNVFGAICYCPITDLNHADMEYEWLYGCTNDGVRHLDGQQKAISAELAALCPEYINSMKLKNQKGELITADNYKDYLKTFLIESAHKALEAGFIIPDSIGIELYKEPLPMMGAGRGAPSFGPGNRPMFSKRTDFVADIDLDKYLSYVASVTPLKTPPAFDQMGVLIPTPSPENKVFGNPQGVSANFTDFSLKHRTDNPDAVLSAEMQKRVHIMNPMYYISAQRVADVAPHWFIRHGASDRDTSFLVPVNLATKLRNEGYDVNFALPWNRPHSGDYNLDDLFAWIRQVCESAK